MENEFNNTDPLQLTASSEPGLPDPNVMFSEAALQRDADFKRIDNFTSLGYSAQDMVEIMGGEEGRTPQGIAEVISAKYEIEESEKRAENERHKREFEENRKNIEDRQAALREQRLKKKVSPSEQGGGFSELGSDGSEFKEAVASPELAAQYSVLSEDDNFKQYTDYFHQPEGVDSPEMIRLAGVNTSLANAASMGFYTDELLESLSDGDMGTAMEMYEALQSMGAEPSSSLDNAEGEELKNGLATWGRSLKEEHKGDAAIHMVELKEVYKNLGIDYNLNPESALDMQQAIFEAYDLDEELSSSTPDGKARKNIEDYAKGEMSWGDMRLLGTKKWILQTITSGQTLRAVFDQLAGNEDEAQARFRAVGYIDHHLAIKSKQKLDQMGVSERVQGMGLGESWRADNVSVGEAMMKTFNFMGDLLPDVAFAFLTIGAGSVARVAGKTAATAATKKILAGATKSAINKSLRRQAKIEGRKAFVAAGGRAGTSLMVGASALFGGKSAAATYQSVWDRPDMSEADKLFLSTVVGVAEGTLTYVFSGAEAIGASATRAFISKAGGREGIRTATKEAIKGMTQKKIWLSGLKSAGGEWAEEAMIEVIDQGTRNMIDWSNGREPKPIDWLAIEDAGLGGLLGTGPMAVLGTASRSYSHSKVSGVRTDLLKALEENDNLLLVTESPAAREVLKAKRRSLLSSVASLDATSQKEFDKLTDLEKESVGGLAREMETLKGEIEEAKDNNDYVTAKVLEDQFQQKLELKQEIEEAASTRDPVASTVSATDSDGNENISTSKDVTPGQKASNDVAPVADATQVVNDSDTSDAAEETKADRKLTSTLSSLGKHLGLISSDPENRTKHKRTTKAQRTKAINLIAAQKGGSTEAVAEATAEVDAYIEAKEYIAAAERGEFALDKDGYKKLQEAKRIVEDTEKPKAPQETAPEETVPPLEDDSVTIESGEVIDLNADWIGSGEGQINLTVIAQVQRLQRAFGKILSKFGIKIQIHKTVDSAEKATGSRSYGAYMPSTKTIHISPKSTKSDVQEEFGHAVFRTLMSTDSKLRDSVYQELAAMNKAITLKDDGTIDTSYWVESSDKFGINFVSDKRKKEYNSNPALKALIDTEILYAGKDTDIRKEEAIMSALTAYASNPNQFKGAKGEGFINRAIRIINRVIKRGGYEGNYITSQDSFFSMAAKFKQATEGVETEVEVNSKDYTSPQEGGLDSKKFAPRPNLNNTEIFYNQVTHTETNRGVSNVSSTRDRSVKVKDYWHFYNLYAKLTGNGVKSKRMQKMFYVKDGLKYPLDPPSPKRDRKTGKVLEMDVPYLESYKMRQSRGMVENSAQVSELNRQRSQLLTEVGDLYSKNDKKISFYTNLQDFSPLETEDIPGKETVESVAAEVEALVISKKNLQALIASDLTAEDLESLAGGKGGHIPKESNPEFFNMSGLTPFSQAQEGEAFGEESVPPMDGMESRKFELKGNLSKVLTENRGDIREVAGFKARVFGYDRTHKGSGLRALMNKTIKWGERDAVVITAHRDGEIADIVIRDLEKMVQQEIRDGNYDQETGIGYIATMEALLKDGSSLGNPTVFKGVIDKYGSKETFERALNARSKKGVLTDSAEIIRREIRVGAIPMGFEAQELKTAMLSSDVDLTEVQVAQIKKILKPSKTLDKKSFKRRTLIAKKMLSKEQRQEVYKEVNDVAWGSVKTAEVVAYTKIPFKVDPTSARGFTGFDTAPDKASAAFSGLIIEDGTIVEKPQLKIVEELYSIPELFPGMFPSVDEDVDVPMSELSAEDQMKQASTLAGISQVRGRVLTSEWSNANDTTQEDLTVEQDTLDSRKFESRGGMTEAETDNGPFQLREKTWVQEWKDKWLRRLADKYRDVMMIQEDIEINKGSAVKESQDFKMAEERMYGKAAYDLQRLEERTKEITSLMKESGVTQGQLSDYMYALHAKERNALILERDGKEDGSGMTDSEADAILDGLDPSTKANLDGILKIVRDVQKDTRKAMVKFGLESQETVDMFESQFEHYVPLSGIAIDEQDSANSFYPTGGAGLSVQGDAYKKASGRKSKAQNLLAQIISQNASMHIQGRTNEAIQSLHELVVSNPNSKVWTVVETASYGDAHVVPVRINGEQKFIRFADSSYAESLKGMSVPRTSALVKMLRAPANWLRRSFTTLNPEFVISNFSRDIQSAVFNAMAEADIEGGALLGTDAVKDILKMVGPSLKTLVKGVAGKSGDPLIEKYYTEFQEDGGKTGWAFSKNLTDIAADLEKETTDKSTAQNILGKLESFANTIEGVNDAFENSIRLASYIGARENGISRGKAAQLAKNITVNFNKHGEYGQALNAVYLFFNASIQGTARLGRSLLTLKPPAKPNGVNREWYERINGAQKLAAGLTVFNAMLTMISRAVSDEDEDGTLFYDKIPDYVKERNLIFMFDGENYIKVPMPYGFNIFANLGSAAVDTAAGAKEPEESMMFLANSFMGAFSPISFGQSKDLFTSVGKSATPTVLKPLVEIMTNETYFGGPVYAGQSPYASPNPESSMSFRSPEAIQDFFEWMNEVTGGSKHVPGNIDMNPDKFWHVFDYFLGGAGQFVTRTGETAFKVGQKLTVDNDVQVEFNDIPLMRKMYGEPSKYYDFGKFKERETEINQLVREYKNDKSEDLTRYRNIGRLNTKLKSINKKLKVLRAKRKEARDITGYAERSIRTQELLDKERSLIMEFNRIYEKIKQ